MEQGARVVNPIFCDGVNTLRYLLQPIEMNLNDAERSNT